MRKGQYAGWGECGKGDTGWVGVERVRQNVSLGPEERRDGLGAKTGKTGSFEHGGEGLDFQENGTRVWLSQAAAVRGLTMPGWMYLLNSNFWPPGQRRSGVMESEVFLSALPAMPSYVWRRGLRTPRTGGQW